MENQFHALIAKNFPIYKCYTLNKGSLHNLEFWKLVLPNLNQIPFQFINFNKDNISIHLFTDAAGKNDCGIGAWDTSGFLFCYFLFCFWINNLKGNPNLVYKISLSSVL